MMMNPRRRLIVGATLAGLSPWAAQAQQWPDRPLRFVVPLPPGGSYDYLARALGEPLSKQIGQPVVVENRAGADGRIGIAHLARQPADGYSIGIISVTNVTHPSLFKNIPYDILKDFQPVALVAHAPFVLLAGPALPDVKTARDYVELARRKPGAVTFGSSGVGSPFHIGGEQFKAALGLDMLHVAYKGSGPLATDLLGGQVMSAFAPVGPNLQHIRTGRLRALATLTDERLAVLPDVPTMSEALGLPGLSMVSWLGIVAPQGTPAPLVERLNREINAIVRDPQFVRDKLAPQAYEPMTNTPQAMQQLMSRDLEKYAKIIRTAGITAE